MRRIFFLILILSISLFIPSVFAINYGTVKDITSTAGDSLTNGSGSLETKGDTTYIRYSAATFKILPEDKGASDGQRPGPAAWIGFQVNEPSDGDSSFKVTLPDGSVSQIKNSVYKDYVGITPDNLKNSVLKNKMLTYKYSFDWDENNSLDQHVVIEVDPYKITLMSLDNKKEEWNSTIAENILIQNRENNPNTSDINLWIFILLLISGCFGLVYCYKK